METYFRYLENVLGLKTLVWPEMEIPEPVPEEPADRITVLYLAEKSWSPAARDLFEKMREATKIPADKTRVLFTDQVSEPELQVAALSADRVVCFSRKLFEQISVETDVKFFAPSPEELLVKPALKKVAWEELKKVMKSLGIL